MEIGVAELALPLRSVSQRARRGDGFERADRCFTARGSDERRFRQCLAMFLVVAASALTVGCTRTTVTILQPSDNSTLPPSMDVAVEGDAVRESLFLGFAISSRSVSADIEWSSDVEGVFASGAQGVLPNPASGPRLITARVRSASDSVRIEVDRFDLSLSDLRVTQSGLVDRFRPPGDLVAGKTTLLRATVGARDLVQGIPTTAGSAVVDVINEGTGSTVTTVQGYAIAADDETLLPVINDGDHVHFFIPGDQLEDGKTYRFVPRLFKNSRSYPHTGVSGLTFRANDGIPLVTVEYVPNNPDDIALLWSVGLMARQYPVADGWGPLGVPRHRGKGVRSLSMPGSTLPATGSLNDFTREYRLSNMMVGTGLDTTGQNCSANVPSQFWAGVFVPINFTFPEDLGRDGTFDASDLQKCQGSPTPMGVRVANFGSFMFNDAATQRTNLGFTFANDKPVFGIVVLSGGGTGQNRTGWLGNFPTGLSASRTGWATVMDPPGPDLPAIAHEIGHGFGLSHDGAAIPSPAYDLRNQRRVWNPVAIMPGNIAAPVQNAFFTSSQYDFLLARLQSAEYDSLANAASLSGVAGAGTNAAVADSRGPLLYLAGSLTETGDLRIDLSRVVDNGLVSEPLRGDITVRYLDGAGREVLRTSFDVDPEDIYPDHPEEIDRMILRPFTALIDFDARATSVVFERKGHEVGRISISPHPPTVQFQGDLPRFDRDRVELAWEASDPDGDELSFDLTLLYPESNLVVGIAQGLKSEQVEFSTARLPGGSAIRLRLVANDGIHSAVAEIPGIQIPNRAPRVVIEKPTSGTNLVGGGAILLRALAFDLEDRVLTGDQFRWSSDLQGLLGIGESLLVDLEQGRHVITVEVKDGAGAEVRSQVQVTVGGN